jgi:hypothetical protein
MAQGAAQAKFITPKGKTLKLNAMTGLTYNPVKWIALGTGDVDDATAADDAGLDTMCTADGLVAQEATINVAAGVATWTTTFTYTGASTVHITNLGLFAAGTVMYMFITLGSGAGQHIDLTTGEVFKVTITDTE